MTAAMLAQACDQDAADPDRSGLLAVYQQTYIDRWEGRCPIS